ERNRETRGVDAVREDDRGKLPPRGRRWTDGKRQRRVLSQDRRLERPQARIRFHTELLHERRARRAILAERIGLTSLPIEREHQLLAQPLAQRLRGDERLKLGDEVASADGERSEERRVGEER